LDTASHLKLGDYTLYASADQDPLGQSFILDRSYNNLSIGGFFIEANPSWPNHDIIFSLVSGLGTDGALIATESVTLPDSFVRGFYMVDFPSIGILEQGEYTALFSGGGSPRVGLGATAVDDPHSSSFNEFGIFPFTNGNKDFMVRVTADVVPSSIPVPATFLLFSSGLIGLIGVKKAIIPPKLSA